MACTKYTLEQYNALNEAIALGANEVTYGDKKVKYNSFAEMLRLQILMQDCLFPSANDSGNQRRRFVNFSKGTSK